MKNKLKAVILAGGKGTRLQEKNINLPKVLREANGKPLLEYVLAAVNMIPKDDIIIVVGYKKEDVMERFPDFRFAYQEQQLGTGHAVMCAIEQEDLEGYKGDIIVLCGDTPAITPGIIDSLCKEHTEKGNDCTVLSCKSEDDPSLGRIIRENGKFTAIVEAKDCTDEQKKITEKNSGMMVFNAQKLCKTIKMLGNNNNQKEYYLTDVPKIMQSKGMKVEAYMTEDKSVLMGVNTKENLLEVESLLKERESNG